MPLELVVFTGLEASGKTSFYRLHLADTHAHVSKDAWPNARNKERRQRRLIESYLAADRSVVVDNTNPTSAERLPLIELAHRLGALAISYAFVVTVDDALRRNATRPGRARIADVGIFSVAKRLVAPGPDEPFAARFVVELSPAGFAVTPITPAAPSPP